MGFDPYILDGERVVLSIHRHWARLVGPVAAVAAGLIFALFVDAAVPPTARLLANVVWLGWMALIVRLVWLFVDWRTEWFVATDKRLLLISGVVARSTGMMPLAKVTDMSLVRSLFGLALGYGKFVLESAGQDQALREVAWIPNPERTYRTIVAEIFDVADRYRVLPDDPAWPGGGGGPEHDFRPPTGDASRAIPIHAPAPKIVYSSDGGQAAKTGAIPLEERPRPTRPGDPW